MSSMMCSPLHNPGPKNLINAGASLTTTTWQEHQYVCDPSRLLGLKVPAHEFLLAFVYLIDSLARTSLRPRVNDLSTQKY